MNEIEITEQLRATDWNQFLGLNNKTIGTETDKETLIRLAKTGAVRRLIFLGPPGSGKTTAALLFARTYLNISSKESESIRKLDHPNLLMINASDERGIDKIRDLIEEFFSIKTDNNKCRIIIFDEADGLTNDAKMALKNATEEYSYNVISIFCANSGKKLGADDPEKPGAALFSRAPVFYFDPLPHKEMLKWFEEKCIKFNITISTNVAGNIISWYRGDMRKLATFIGIYRDQVITKWNPRPSYAEDIFKASNPFEKYLQIATKQYIDTDTLLRDLFRLNNYESPAIFAKCFEIREPEIAIAYACTGLKK